MGNVVEMTVAVNIEGLDRLAAIDGQPDKLHTFNHVHAFIPTGRPLLEEAPEALHSIVAGAKWVRQLADSDFAASSAAMAAVTTAVNAAGSVTARSAKTLRSVSMPAA